MSVYSAIVFIDVRAAVFNCKFSKHLKMAISEETGSASMKWKKNFKIKNREF
jgi:hypothetical protein